MSGECEDGNYKVGGFGDIIIVIIGSGFGCGGGVGCEDAGNGWPDGHGSEGCSGSRLQSGHQRKREKQWFIDWF